MPDPQILVVSDTDLYRRNQAAMQLVALQQVISKKLIPSIKAAMRGERPDFHQMRPGALSDRNEIRNLLRNWGDPRLEEKDIRHALAAMVEAGDVVFEMRHTDFSQYECWTLATVAAR